jgi:hypothetical protein
VIDNIHIFSYLPTSADLKLSLRAPRCSTGLAGLPREQKNTAKAGGPISPQTS